MFSNRRFLICTLLLIVLAVSALSGSSATAASAPFMDGSACGYNDLVDGNVPDGVPRCSSNGFKFNHKYYYDTWTMNGHTAPARQLIVYGSVNSFRNSQGENINRFKKGMQWDPNNPNSVELDDGHFYSYQNKYGGYVFGEYEYLGFTQEGQPYHNLYFINDADSSTSNADKHWVFQPWETLPNHYPYKPESPGLLYTDGTGSRQPVNQGIFEKVRRNLQDSLGFMTSQGVSGNDPWKVLSGSDAYADPRFYMNIAQTPTAREIGYGTMYHFSWYSSKYWYQTFPINKMTENYKELTPNDASAKVLDSQPIPILKSKTVPVQIEVSGKLLDDDYFGDYQSEILHYTRQDIKYWRLDLWDAGSQTYVSKQSDKPADSVTQADNTAMAAFSLNVDVTKLDISDPNDWTYKTHAKAYVYFWGKDSKSGVNGQDPYSVKTVEVTVHFKPNVIQGTMKSQFWIKPDVVFNHKSELTPDKLAYRDESVGDDVGKYVINISGDDGSSAAFTYAVSPDTVNNITVNSDLHTFIASRFQATTASKVSLTFTITQQLVDRDNPELTSTFVQTFLAVQQTAPPPPPPQYVDVNIDMPEDWYDVLPYPVQDQTSGTDGFSKACTVDGSTVPAGSFLSGQYVFGIGHHGLHQIHCMLTAPDGTVSEITKWVVIHDTKPRVSLTLSGLFKQNRTMTATNTSDASNDAFVLQHYPNAYTFDFVDNNNPNLKCRGDCRDTLQKVFMYKQPGTYQLTVHAKKNVEGIIRESDPYVVTFMIFPDYKPAIIVHSAESQISRLDALPLTYDVQSTDGDQIASKSLSVYYDSKNNGSFDTQVYTKMGDVSQLPKFTKLGQYKIVVTAKENTDQDRLTEYLTPDDDQTNTVTSYFFIDNYAPLSDLYVEVPNQKPEVDVLFLLDANLNAAASGYVNGNRVTITNAMTTRNMNPAVSIWDMKTYTYSQSASTSSNTGSSYPSNSTYYSSGGYSGTLPLVNVSNSPYSRDEGAYQTVTDSKSATSTCGHTTSGRYNTWGYWEQTSDSGDCPSSKSYSDGQYSGTLSRTGTTGSGCSYTGTPGTTCTGSWTAYYSGTVYWTHQVWVPQMVTYNNYTGQYSGTIYKSVRQPYDVSFFRTMSTKTIVYVSDNTVSQLTDLQYALDKNEANLILIGQNAIQSQISADKYFPNTKPIDQLVVDVLDYIAQHNPQIPKVVRLIGEPVISHTATFDFEGDPMPTGGDKMLITQDPNVFDNPMGFGTVGGQPLRLEKGSSVWMPYQPNLTFDKPGKYQVYRRIQDLPTTDPKFANYAYYSNESVVDVMVHRKPVADFVLDWDYDLNRNQYKTNWTDKSYDLDHNVTRADTDRGIAVRKMRFVNTGTGEVFTSIPAYLPAGAYRIDYTVQDLEGAWSDPVTRTYTLSAAPPVQFGSRLKTQDSAFSLSSVPAGENLVAYELWTRYPYAVQLSLQMGTSIQRTVPYYAGTKTGNDIAWNNVVTTIPGTTPDGTYTFRISAIGSYTGSTLYKDYTIHVQTPIQLDARINRTGETDVATLIVNDPYTLTATTTKYANALSAVLFKGTSYQRSVTLTGITTQTGGIGSKTWSAAFTPTGVPDGMYTVEWTVTTPNGNVERMSKTVQVLNNRPPVAQFDWQPKPLWEGDTVTFANQSSDPDGDPLSSRWTITGPDGSNVIFTTTGVVHRLVKPGMYTVTLTVNDGYESHSITKTALVGELGINGFVKHTEAWDEHRRQFNRLQSGNENTPRPDHQFWAGEKFILEAQTTDTGTATRAVKVEVAMTGSAMRSLPSTQWETSLTSANPAKTKWNGSLHDQSERDRAEQLQDGPLTFAFTVTYSNGTVKTDEEQVSIAGKWTDFYKLHRVQ